MSSKKIIDLNPYTAAELTAAQGIDLLYVTDLAHLETKKITAAEFGKYTNSIVGAYTGSFTGSFTGSLKGTASWATNAGTSSYALNSPSSGIAGGVNIGQGANIFNVYDSISGSYLAFKAIKPGSNVTISEDAGNHTLTINSSVVSPAGTAGGSIGNVQFNQGGVCTGVSGFTFDYTQNQLIITASNPNNAGLLGTASFALLASRAVTASNADYAKNGLSSSYATTSSYSNSGSYATTSSYATTAGVALSVASGVGVKSVNTVNNSTPISSTSSPWNTGISKTITPASTGSNFVINLNVAYSFFVNNDGTPLSYLNSYVQVYLVRTIGASDTTLTTYNVYVNGYQNLTKGIVKTVGLSNLPVTFIDTPNTTSPVTYTLWIVKPTGWSGVVTNYINTNDSAYLLGSTTSTITFIEY